MIMKKTIIVLAILLGFTAVASAQPRAIGLRGGILDGGLCQISYQHYAKAENFVELDLGAFYSESNALFDLSALHNWMIVQPEWTEEGEWGFYLGAGGTVGTFLNDDNNSKVRFGIVGQAGLEYTFKFPLQISVDVRPYLNFCSEPFMLSPCFSVRYRF